MIKTREQKHDCFAQSKYVLCWAAALLCLLLFGCASQEKAPVYDYEAADQAIVSAAAQVRETLDDHYFAYFTEEEYRLLMDDYKGTFGGVDITMLLNDEQQVLVSSVQEGGPAEGAGVLPGDIILAVNGEKLDDLTDVNMAALKIRGDIGTEVTLTLLRDGSQTLDLTMVRDTVSETSVYGDNLSQLAPGLLYLQISTFAENTADEFMEEYNRLAEENGVKGLVLDLRSNTGGNFYAALRIASYFIPKDQVIVTEKMGTEDQEYLSSSGALANLPVMILQNAYTASASEVLAGAMADYGHTVLIGSVSFGKGITQALEPLASGCGLRYTRSMYLTPSGFSLHGVGLTPDIAVEDPTGITAQEYFSMDPAVNPHLAAAIKYFQDL